jgi:hypothetical protein
MRVKQGLDKIRELSKRFDGGRQGKVNSTLYREPDAEAGAMKVPDFEMEGKTGVFSQFH